MAARLARFYYLLLYIYIDVLGAKSFPSLIRTFPCWFIDGGPSDPPSLPWAHWPDCETWLVVLVWFGRAALLPFIRLAMFQWEAFRCSRLEEAEFIH